MGTLRNLAGSERRDEDLFVSSALGDVDGVRRALDRGADVNSFPIEDLTALMSAASKGHTEIVQILLNAGANPNARTGDDDNTTPLIWSANHGYVEVARLLLDAGASVTDEDSEGDTALIKACKGRAGAEIVELLLDRGSEVEFVCGDGLTAVGVAALSFDYGVAELLLKRGADTDYLKEIPEGHWAHHAREVIEKVEESLGNG